MASMLSRVVVRVRGGLSSAVPFVPVASVLAPPPSSVFRASMSTTVGSVLDTNVSARRFAEVFSSPSQKLAWDATELKTHVDALARGLLELGYGKGTKLAVWMGNEAEHVCAQFAAAKIGVVLVSIDPDLSVAAVGRILADEGCRGLMYSERFNGEHRTNAMFDLLPELSQHVSGEPINSKKFRSLRHLISTGFDTPADSGITQYSEFPVYGTSDDSLPSVSASVSGADMAIVHYNKGSDADTPVKGASLTHDELVSSANKTAKAMGIGSSDVVFVTAPLHSMTGLVGGALASTIAGAKMVIPSREFSAEDASSKLVDARATALAAAPEHISSLGDAAKGLKSASL